jgi:hypothetical protein
MELEIIMLTSFRNIACFLSYINSRPKTHTHTHYLYIKVIVGLTVRRKKWGKGKRMMRGEKYLSTFVYV